MTGRNLAVLAAAANLMMWAAPLHADQILILPVNDNGGLHSAVIFQLSSGDWALQLPSHVHGPSVSPGDSHDNASRGPMGVESDDLEDSVGGPSIQPFSDLPALAAATPAEPSRFSGGGFTPPPFADGGFTPPPFSTAGFTPPFADGGFTPPPFVSDGFTPLPFSNEPPPVSNPPVIDRFGPPIEGPAGLQLVPVNTALAPTLVPEPGSITLLVAGAMFLLFRSSRSRRSSSLRG